MPPRVLRLRAHHIATFTPGAEGDESDARDGEPSTSSGAAFTLDAGATLQQARVPQRGVSRC